LKTLFTLYSSIVTLTLMTLNEHIQRIQEVVRSKPRVRPTGGGSKPALSGWGNLRMNEVSGVLEYNPQEYTFTALSGTLVKEVQDLLAKHGQYLPFDPPLVEAGATLGGTVASGLSGPGRYRFGGVRDFLLGVKFVSGEGQLVTGGSKVVKNAAGFDFPKLMVGSLGQFGVLVELTFKVFPKPEAYETLVVDFTTFDEANKAMQKVAMSNLEVACLELLPPRRLLLRVGGLKEVIGKRLETLQEFLGKQGEFLKDEQTWREAREFSWLPREHSLIKIPLSPTKITSLEKLLESMNLVKRYGVGGNVLYVAWPNGEKDQLEKFLNQQGLSALAITGSWQNPLLGKQTGQAFTKRILSVLDPQGKFRIREAL
jgi:glycolate oxidase FAD binding subunit